MSRKALLAVVVAATLVVAAVGVVGLGSAGSDAPAADETDSRTITVSATGSAEAAPDEAVVRVSVTASANDSAAVRSELSSDADALRGALDELDVEYETARYAIRERPPERRQERGDDAPAYRGEHAFEVTVADPNDTGAVIDAAADVGAEVDNVHLTLSDDKRADLRDDAIERAMTDAKTQASTIANAANLTITTAATVDASESQYRPVRYETAAATADAGGGGTTVDAGDVSVTYTVRVTYNATT